jgi:hypothetical protein
MQWIEAIYQEVGPTVLSLVPSPFPLSFYTPQGVLLLFTDVPFFPSPTDWTGITSAIDGRGSTNDRDMSLAHHPTVSMGELLWLPVSGEYVMLVTCL